MFPLQSVWGEARGHWLFHFDVLDVLFSRKKFSHAYIFARLIGGFLYSSKTDIILADIILAVTGKLGFEQALTLMMVLDDNVFHVYERSKCGVHLRRIAAF